MGKKEKNSNFDVFMEVYKVKKEIISMKNSDPKVVENDLFSKFGCNTETEKIAFEARYIKTKLSKEEYKGNSDVEAILKAIDLIINNIDNLKTKDISKYKRYLVLIELKYGLTIGFVSELKGIYEEKVEKMKLYNEQTDSFPVDYVLTLDAKTDKEEKKKRNL